MSDERPHAPSHSFNMTEPTRGISTSQGFFHSKEIIVITENILKRSKCQILGNIKSGLLLFDQFQLEDVLTQYYLEAEAQLLFKSWPELVTYLHPHEEHRHMSSFCSDIIPYIRIVRTSVYRCIICKGTDISVPLTYLLSAALQSGVESWPPLPLHLYI